MLIKAVPAIPSREITDEQIYLRRREFLRLAGGAAFAAAASPLLAWRQRAVGGRAAAIGSVFEGPASARRGKRKRPSRPTRS
jgi:hypothetical protein